MLQLLIIWITSGIHLLPLHRHRMKGSLVLTIHAQQATVIDTRSFIRGETRVVASIFDRDTFNREDGVVVTGLHFDALGAVNGDTILEPLERDRRFA